MSDRRELYRSPNGDAWFIAREPASGHAFIIHQPNAPSGGRYLTSSWVSSCVAEVAPNSKHCCE